MEAYIIAGCTIIWIWMYPIFKTKTLREKDNSMLFERRHQFIKRQIKLSKTQGELQGCEKMIDNMLYKMGAYEMAWSLINEVQMKKVELIAQRYPEYEQ